MGDAKSLSPVHGGSRCEGLSRDRMAQAAAARSLVNEAKNRVIADSETRRKRRAYYRYRGEIP